MAPKKDDNGPVDSLFMSKEDSAFILGAGGKTKCKLATVSGAQLDLVEIKGGKGTSRLEIRGGTQERIRAKKYIEFVTKQRHGPVKINESEHHDDLTILQVPADAVSFVTGKQGSFLRAIEEEWGALLFFLSANLKDPAPTVDPNQTERLAIFGPERGRRGAELKVMAAVEMKHSGYFAHAPTLTVCAEQGFGTDTLPIEDDDYSYALGRNGATRKKLARASGCIVEYVGRTAHFSGTKQERIRAREYLQWLLQRRANSGREYFWNGPDLDTTGRDDVSVIMVPPECVGGLTGNRGHEMRLIEEESFTFCFVDGGYNSDANDPRKLMIFGVKSDRRQGETLVWERITQTFEDGANGVDHSKSSGGKGKGRKGDGRKGGNSRYEDTSAGDRRDRDRERERDREHPREPRVTGEAEVVPVTDDDAAFIMGPGGRTKRKVAAVSGASLDLRGNRLEIIGTEEARQRAKKYVGLVTAQRIGPVRIEKVDEHDDLTLVEVPPDAVSFVTGRGGSFLRLVEEEFGALLFFLDFSRQGRRDRVERLAIFGPERERRGAELKVMAAVEMKQPGYFTKGDGQLPPRSDKESFATDFMPIDEEDYSYALGKGGATRKKIARASGCIIEYVYRLAYLSGLKDERKRAWDYLTWLFQQRVGPVEVEYHGRKDVTVLEVPKDCVGFVTGHRGASLRSVEDASGTFCFIEGGRDDPHRDPKPLLIFGPPEARKVAEERLKRRIEQKLEEGWVDETNGKGSSWGEKGGDRYDRRSDRHESRRDGGRSGKGRKGKGDDRKGDSRADGAKGDGGKGDGGKSDGRKGDGERGDQRKAPDHQSYGHTNGGYPPVSAATNGGAVEGEPVVDHYFGAAGPEYAHDDDEVPTEWPGDHDEDEAPGFSAPAATPAPAAAASAPSVPSAGAAPSAFQGGAAQLDDDEGGDWGDWGGQSDDDDAEYRDSTPPPNGRVVNKWHTNLLLSQVPTTPLRPVENFDEFEPLPPQLMHEEAWPELGGLGAGGPKKGKRK